MCEPRNRAMRRKDFFELATAVKNMNTQYTPETFNTLVDTISAVCARSNTKFSPTEFRTRAGLTS